MRRLLLLAALLSLVPLSYAQYYDVSIVRANDSTVSSLAYDDNSTSYKDSSIENPDMLLRICSMEGAPLLGMYYALAYADGFDGDFLIVEHAPKRITAVQPNLCAYAPLEIDSFKAWYPSIPYVFLSPTPDMNGAERWKLSRLRGWFIGNYTVNRTQAGSQVNITVVDSIEDTGASIVTDVDYLVIGLVREDFTTMDTAVSSPNDTVQLTADTPTAVYQIFINGIGPDIPPYVEIITPEPITYTTGTIPFTYLMYDDDDIVGCWYVLDGVNVTMPSCSVAYILNVGDGSHALILYGLDTTGNVGSDSVSFRVETGGQGGGGGGGGGVPVYPHVPPSPPEVHLTIIPEDIWVLIDYPLPGVADFSLQSTADLSELECFVKGDFGQYSTVEIRDSIRAGETITGTITVNMTPGEILDYNGSRHGVLQCVGKSHPTLSSSSVANVHLIINKPVIELENRTVELENLTVEMAIGQRLNQTMLLHSIPQGNATAINLSIAISAYQSMMHVYGYPDRLGPGEWGYIQLVVDTFGVDEGVYRVPLEVYENGRFMTRGYLIINVKRPEVPVSICEVPDLSWTMILLVMGLIGSVAVFYRRYAVHFRKEMKGMKVVEKMSRRDKYERYLRPFGRALLVMLIFFALWLICIWLFAKCQ